MVDVPKADEATHVDWRSQMAVHRQDFHRWFATRPDALADAILEVAAEHIDVERARVLDLCSGLAPLSAAALRMGSGDVLAVDLHPIPVVATRCRYQDLPAALARQGASQLAAQFDRALDRLIERFLAATEEIPDVQGPTVYTRVVVCAGCGESLPITREETSGAHLFFRRGHVQCSQCGNSSRMDWTLAPLRAEPRYPSDEGIGTLEYCDATEVFVHAGGSKIPRNNAQTSRQFALWVALQDAAKAAIAQLDTGEVTGRFLASLLALTCSEPAALLNTFVTLQRVGNSERVVPPLARLAWAWTPEFVEVPRSYVVDKIRQKADGHRRTILATSAQSGEIRVEAGDQCSLALPSRSVDLLLWDPPYFDNVDYDRLAGPWTSFVAPLLAKVHPRLPWDTHLPEAMVPNGGSSRDERAQDYESAMVAALTEISRVMAQDGVALILWTVADSEGEDQPIDQPEAETALAFMARMLTGADLRVVAAHRYTTERSHNISNSARRRDPIVLVVQRGSTVEDASIDRVIAAVDDGLPVLDFGLAEVLVEFLDQDELEAEIPERYAGTLVQRLAESVHHRDDPRSLVEKLRRSELATIAIRYGIPDSLVAGSGRGPLVDMVFECLGWVSPTSASYSCLDSIEKIESARQRMKDSLDDTVRRGSTMEAIEAIEGLLSFASLSFAALIDQENPLAVIAEVVGRDSKLSFGHWRQAFVGIPKRKQNEEYALRAVAKSHKKADLGRLLDNIVKLRNDASHDGRIDWYGPMRDIDRLLAQFAAKARGLVDNRGLPRVLTPLRESRDRFGRITLACVDSRGYEYTFAMTAATDLSRPFIHIAGDNNPQEVDPAMLPIDAVADFLPNDLFPQ